MKPTPIPTDRITTSRGVNAEFEVPAETEVGRHE